ncbi:MAG: PadR family transcriptional regulator, partial [Gammaproteobacteria bacterium]
PGSGYDLKKEFESLFKHFFPAGYGSIYPALADLTAQGYLVCEEIPQVGKPDRKVYEVTEAGRRAFAAALREAEPQHKLRSEFLATIYFAEMMDGDRLKQLLDQRAMELSQTVERINEIASDREDKFPAGARFVAGFGAAVAQAAAQYIAEHGQELLKETRQSQRDRGSERPSATPAIETRL